MSAVKNVSLKSTADLFPLGVSEVPYLYSESKITVVVFLTDEDCLHFTECCWQRSFIDMHGGGLPNLSDLSHHRVYDSLQKLLPTGTNFELYFFLPTNAIDDLKIYRFSNSESEL